MRNSRFGGQWPPGPALTRRGGHCHIRTMSTIRTICVYCGSGPGTDPAFEAAARAFGEILARNGVRLVYGGGSLGLMGALARSVIENGGEVTGVIPEFLSTRERKLLEAQEI